jgi:hypothetical protein
MTADRSTPAPAPGAGAEAFSVWRRVAAWVGALLALPLVWAWVAFRGWRCGRAARVLTARERAAVGGHFPASLLDSVRVLHVARLQAVAGWGVLRRLGAPRAWDLAQYRGMCFGRVVVIAGAPKEVPLGVLFHELVHAAQYARAGRAAFLFTYARDYLRTGDYWRIGAEVEAYEQQARFERERRGEGK